MKEKGKNISSGAGSMSGKKSFEEVVLERMRKWSRWVVWRKMLQGNRKGDILKTRNDEETQWIGLGGGGFEAGGAQIMKNSPSHHQDFLWQEVTAWCSTVWSTLTCWLLCGDFAAAAHQAASTELARAVYTGLRDNGEEDCETFPERS